MAKKSLSRKQRANPVSGAKKAGIHFSVARTTRLMRERRLAPRISAGAGAFLAAVLEFISHELLDGAGVNVPENVVRIAPKHIAMAVRSDTELAKLMASVTISAGGQMEHIEEALLPKKKGKAAEGASQA